MAISIQRIGYGQVEPNHLSAQYTGQIYAQLPAMKVTGTGTSATTEPIDILENGQFLKYNYADGRASVDGDGEWMLVYNEEKLYDDRFQSHKDFAMKADEMSDKTIYPRLLKTNVGDIFTTNTFKTNATGMNTKLSDNDAISLSVGAKLVVGNDGFLAIAGENPTGPIFQVVKEYTLADKQNAVKIQRIQ